LFRIFNLPAAVIFGFNNALEDITDFLAPRRKLLSPLITKLPNPGYSSRKSFYRLDQITKHSNPPLDQPNYCGQSGVRPE
jgi:hypothetical protein